MEYVKNLVSIITPCYNAEEFIAKYIRNVVEQSYKNIELILINDGSTDNTEKIILENKDFIESNGITLKYFSLKKNNGQACAYNLALKNLSGEFFLCMDCDDTMTKDCIIEKVTFLQNNPQYSFCSSKVEYIDKNGNELFTINQDNWLKKENIFWDILLLNCQPYHCLCRTESFYKALNEKDISTRRAGQNLQILLPLSYVGKFGYIEKSLSQYLRHDKSHSNTIKNKFTHSLELFKIAEETLSKMKIEERDLEWGKIILNINRIRLFYSILVRFKRIFFPYKIKNKIRKITNRKGA